MPEPTHVSSSSGSTTAAVVSTTVTAPAGRAVGHLMTVVIWLRDPISTTAELTADENGSMPSGWNKLGVFGVVYPMANNPYMGYIVYWKFVVTADLSTSTYAFGHHSSLTGWQMHVTSGAESVDGVPIETGPFGLAPQGHPQNTGTSAGPHTILNSASGLESESLMYVMAGFAVPGTATPTATDPSGYTSRAIHQAAINNVSSEAWTAPAQADGVDSVSSVTTTLNSPATVLTPVVVRVYGKPRTPNLVAPAAGATLTDSTPTLTAALLAGTFDQWVEFRLAKDAGFASDLRTITPAAGTATKSSGNASLDVPQTAPLGAGLWYMQGRSRMPSGSRVSAWSSSRTFQVGTKPSVTGESPTLGQIVPHTASRTLDWEFSDSDPFDNQTAYEVEVQRVDTSATVVSTGKVVSTTTSYSMNMAALAEVQLRWRVRVYDSDDTVSDWSAYNVFTAGTIPVVTIASPATGSVVNNPAPVITWSRTISGGRTQKSYTVLIIRNSDGAVIHNSGVVNSSDTAYAVPSPVLVNTVGYSVQVQIYDTGGLSGVDTNTFTATWTPPATPSGKTYSTSNYEALGYVQVSWTNTAKDADFLYYRVYRRAAGGAWELVYQTSASQTTYVVYDYLAKSGVTYDYAVVQVVNRFGTPLESDYAPLTLATVISTKYWLIVENNNTTDNIMLNAVTGDDPTEEYEQATINLIGRGRRVEYGTRYGFTGTLTAQLWDRAGGPTARAQKQTIETFKARRAGFFLRNPFGDLWYVAAGDISFSRLAGVGRSELGTITIPYQEISD